MLATGQLQAWGDIGVFWQQRHRRSLKNAVLISMLVHLILMAYFFSTPKASRPEVSTLEVILVNSESETAPKQADALAQVALDGGGEQNEGRAKSPFPMAQVVPATPPPSQAEEKIKQLESQQKALKAEALKPREAVVKERTAPEQNDSPKVAETSQPQSKPAPAPALSTDDLKVSAREIARLEAQIAKQIEDYNKRPRLHFFAPSTSPYVFAMYEESWRQKVERYGNLNYPSEAKGKYYGQLRLTVYIKKDGSVQSVELDKSSGLPILDRAALRIVEMAGPYGAFTPEMLKNADVLVITRTWMFTNDALETRQR